MTGENEHLQQLNANNYSIIIMFNVNNVRHMHGYGETVAVTTCRVCMRHGNFFVCSTPGARYTLHSDYRIIKIHSAGAKQWTHLSIVKTL